MSDAVSLAEQYPHIAGRRRRDQDGRALHACCVCGRLAPWTDNWRWYGSYKQIDDGDAVMKFCPKHAAQEFMVKAVNQEMAEEARRREYTIAETPET